MIGRIKGNSLRKRDSVVIDVHGIGYVVSSMKTARSQTDNQSRDISFTHRVACEGGLITIGRLYNSDRKDWLNDLTISSGIGAKVASQF